MNIQKAILKLISFFVVFFAGINTSQSAPLELTHDPLFLQQSTPPAIAVTYDDSGSMQRAYVEGMSNVSTSADFADYTINRLYYNPNVTYRPPIGPNGAEFQQSSMTAARVDAFTDSITATIDLTQNYVPIRTVQYQTDGDVLINFSRAGHPNLRNIKTQSWTNEYPSDDAIADENLPGGDLNSGVPAFYYEKNALGVRTRVTVPEEQYDNFANWYTYNNSRMKLGRTAMSRTFSTFGGSFKIAWQQLNRNTTFPVMDRFEGDHKTEFFNDWLFKVPTSGGTPLRDAFVRAGNLFKVDDTYDYKPGVPTDIEHLTCQQNFHIAISDGAWKQTLDQSGHASVIFDETSTTLPDGKQYTGTGSQQIFSANDELKTLSDISFHYWATDLSDFTNNVRQYAGDYTAIDGTQIVPPIGDELWDVDEFYWNPKNDPADWQHMVTYNIGFGLNATLVEDYIKKHVDEVTGATSACDELPTITDPKEAVLKQLRTGNCSWPAIPTNQEFNEIVEKVDDVFHSSINSRGDFFSATNPDELIEALTDVINSINKRVSQGGSTGFTSAVVTAETQAFSPGFDSSSWTGTFIARDVLNTSEFGPPLWDTACYLTGATSPYDCDTVPELNGVSKQSRSLYTYDKVNDAVIDFSGNLSGQAAIEVQLASAADRTKFNVDVADIVSYVAGDTVDETFRGGNLRNRQSIMADIVHSSPVVIRGPGESYTKEFWPQDSELFGSDSYLDFKVENQERKNLAFIGSNGGMLHAIDVVGESAGKERWGYVPFTALRNIHRLIDPSYKHWSFVDNTPVLGDAYLNSEWKSVLIGGMRYGGQAFYALDVTDTDATQPEVLWEFTDADDADMGFSYGQATIARISSTDEWVALIPNGYNNSQNDYPDPNDPRNHIGDGTAVLYVVRLSDGELLAKLDTNVGTADTPNGLSSAVAVDTNSGPDREIDLGADYAYAGDVYGNLWRFNFESDNYADWETSIERVVQADVIKSKPISQKPRVVFLPDAESTTNRDSVVMFATGKYIELPDRSTDIDDQFIIGIYDGIDNDWTTNTLSISDTGFVSQSFDQSDGSRHLTNNPVEYNDNDVVGWKILLPDDGERVNTPLELFGRNILLVASTVPLSEDPCSSGAYGWIMAINPLTGATPFIGEIFKEIIVDADGNAVSQVTSTGVRVSEPPIGSINILEPQGGGGANILIEGADDLTIIEIDKFTWRRRNWTNLLTE